jgi:drug/metabolite transporter (DMT)-like permease
VAIVLALSCALAWGISDFIGGLWSRRQGPWVVAFVVQTGALASTALVALAAGQPVSRPDAAWAVVAGLGAGSGTALLYRGLARGSMGVVAPMSAVTAALVPMTIGIATGERPGLWAMLGICLALPAIWLVSADSREEGRGGAWDGLWSGLGFGVYFLGSGQIEPDHALTPLALIQAVAFVPIVLLASLRREPLLPRSRSAWTVLWIGPLVAAANAAFLWAVDLGQLVITSVLASLYPAVTVGLAALVLHERIRRWQGVGLGLAALAVVLISLP